MLDRQLAVLACVVACGCKSEERVAPLPPSSAAPAPSAELPPVASVPVAPSSAPTGRAFGDTAGWSSWKRFAPHCSFLVPGPEQGPAPLTWAPCLSTYGFATGQCREIPGQALDAFVGVSPAGAVHVGLSRWRGTTGLAVWEADGPARSAFFGKGLDGECEPRLLAVAGGMWLASATGEVESSPENRWKLATRDGALLGGAVGAASPTLYLDDASGWWDGHPESADASSRRFRVAERQFTWRGENETFLRGFLFDDFILSIDISIDSGVSISKGGGPTAELVAAEPDQINAVSTDGRDLVWTRLESAPDGGAPRCALYDAPFTTDAAKLRPVRVGPSTCGQVVVGCGHAARMRPGGGVELLRLRDGVSWTLSPQDCLGGSSSCFRDVLALTCKEIFLRTSSVVRVRLDALGPGSTPAEPPRAARIEVDGGASDAAAEPTSTDGGGDAVAEAGAPAHALRDAGASR